MSILLSIGEVSRLLGVCVNTIRNWEVIGKLLPTCRTLGGHRRYRLDKIQNLRGEGETNPGLTVAYARVSSHDQSADLERQKERLLNECKQRGYDNVELIADLGSGLNFAKKGLRRLLRLIMTQQVQRAEAHSAACCVEAEAVWLCFG